MEYDHLSLYRELIGCDITVLAVEIQKVASASAKKPTVIARVKDAIALEKKMSLKGATHISQIDDIYGLRILVDSTEEIYEVLGRIQQLYAGRVDHDYVASPKTRADLPGKALRLLQFVANRNSVTFEIQIATRAFNEANELLHDEYKHRKYRGL